MSVVTILALIYGIKTTSRTGNGGLGLYYPSPPFPVRDIVLIPGLLPIFLHGCEIKSGRGLGTRLRGSLVPRAIIPQQLQDKIWVGLWDKARVLQGTVP